MAEIAAASREQSAGIEQVNKAVMQLDELTQQNAALVEQASAASQTMAEQAGGLNESMQRFRVNDAAAAAEVTMASQSAAPTTAAPAGNSGSSQPNERRKAGRPWISPPNTQAATAVAAPRKVGAEPDSSIWNDF